MGMCLNDEQLKELQQFAELFYTVKEIAVIMQLNAADLIAEIKNESGPVYENFFAGRMRAEAMVRKSIIKLAQQGSSPAQAMAMKMYSDSKIKLYEK